MEEEEGLLGVPVRTPARRNRLKRYKWILISVSLILLLLALVNTPAVSQHIAPLYSTSPTTLDASASILIESPSLSSPSTKLALPPTATRSSTPAPTQIIATPTSRRYLSYQPHSGFHNQRMELTNALTLATLLNRTLLLPPVRLGRAQAWAIKLELEQYLQEAEENKRRCTDRSLGSLGQESPVAVDAEGVAHSDENEMVEADEEKLDDLRRRQLSESQCDESAANAWTYLPWSHLLDPSYLAQFSLLPRNNISRAYLSSPTPFGLGISPSETYYFDDADRRSIRIFDLTAAQMERGNGFKGRFTESVTLEQLSAIPSATEGRRTGNFTREFGDFELLHFGSMFASSRLSFDNAENKKLKSWIENGVILGNPELDKLSSLVRDALGDYVGVHARVGDGAFKKYAKSNMADVFYHTCKTLGLSDELIESLYPRQAPYTVFPGDESKSAASKGTRQGARRNVRSRLGGVRGEGQDSESGASGEAEESQDYSGRRDEFDDFETDYTSTPLPTLLNSPSIPPTILRRQKQASPPNFSPKSSPPLSCRSSLHTNPSLLPLNRPIYLATDSKSPESDITLKPFFDNFPCLFTLADFAFPASSSATTSSNGHLSNGNDKGRGSHLIQEVVDLAKTINSWDGQSLGRFLWPFLEAEIIAKGSECQGTSGSTFSIYACGILHRSYQPSRVD